MRDTPERDLAVAEELGHMANARIAELERERDALKLALVSAAIPYEALLLDAESRRWIAPDVWSAIEKALENPEWAEGYIKHAMACLPARLPDAAPKKYFCSCGAACTAEEYIEHFFEKGHDRGDASLPYCPACGAPTAWHFKEVRAEHDPLRVELSAAQQSLAEWESHRDGLIELVQTAEKNAETARADAIRECVDAVQAVQNTNDLDDGGFFEAGFIAARTKSIDALLDLESITRGKKDDGRTNI
jgi:hypothetical protein